MPNRLAAIGAPIAAALILACGSPVTALPGGGGAGQDHLVAAHHLSTKGSPEEIASVFHRDRDRAVYVVVPIHGLPAGTEVSFVRYLNDKYLDNRSSKLAKPGRSFVFAMKAKPGHQLAGGKYRYKIYIDSRYRDQIEFQVT